MADVILPNQPHRRANKLRIFVENLKVWVGHKFNNKFSSSLKVPTIIIRVCKNRNHYLMGLSQASDSLIPALRLGFQHQETPSFYLESLRKSTRFVLMTLEKKEQRSLFICIWFILEFYRFDVFIGSISEKLEPQRSYISHED